MFTVQQFFSGLIPVIYCFCEIVKSYPSPEPRWMLNLLNFTGQGLHALQKKKKQKKTLS